MNTDLDNTNDQDRYEYEVMREQDWQAELGNDTAYDKWIDERYAELRKAQTGENDESTRNRKNRV